MFSFVFWSPEGKILGFAHQCSGRKPCWALTHPQQFHARHLHICCGSCMVGKFAKIFCLRWPDIPHKQTAGNKLCPCMHMCFASMCLWICDDLWAQHLINQAIVHVCTLHQYTYLCYTVPLITHIPQHCSQLIEWACSSRDLECLSSELMEEQLISWRCLLSLMYCMGKFMASTRVVYGLVILSTLHRSIMLQQNGTYVLVRNCYIESYSTVL